MYNLSIKGVVTIKVSLYTSSPGSCSIVMIIFKEGFDIDKLSKITLQEGAEGI